MAARPGLGTVAIPRLVLGGTASGVGKTTLVVSLIRALRSRGLGVAAFKAGPVYLDPTYHARATGAACHNLDGWMMGRQAVRATFARAAEGADIALIEGVMGLYDGASPTGEAGSTAEIAKWLEAPVLLVVDASGMARSIAALAQGFSAYDPALRVAGVLANRVGSRGHLDLLRQALRDPPILGGLPTEPALAFPERHLGLRSADAQVLPDRLLDAWGATATEWITIDRLLEVARSAPPLERIAASPARAAPRCRIGVALDAAFHFYYEDNLRRLQQLGAELVCFSPIADPALPAVDGLYLGGGYPEAHAEALSSNGAMRGAIADFAARGGPIYAECGGLMYLSGAIRTCDARSHAMVGLLPGVAVVHDRLQALGYVEVETQARSLLGPAGARFRGHQFRYSELVEVPDATERLYRVRRRRGGDVTLEGYRVGSVVASYVHAHWASNPLVAESFVAACSDARAHDG